MIAVLLSLVLTSTAQAEQRPIEQPRSVADLLQQCEILTLQTIPLDQVGTQYIMQYTAHTVIETERPTTTPVLAGKLTSVPGVRLDGQGRVALRDMQAHELGVVMDGTWMPGATFTSAKGGHPHVTPIQRR